MNFILNCLNNIKIKEFINILSNNNNILLTIITIILSIISTSSIIRLRKDLKDIHNRIKEIEKTLNISNKFEEFKKSFHSELKCKMEFNKKQKEELEKKQFNKKDIINELKYLENNIKQNSDIIFFISIINIILVALSILSSLFLYNENKVYSVLFLALLLMLIIILSVPFFIKIKDKHTYKGYLLIYLEYINRLRNNIINLYEEEQKENNHIIKETKNIQNIYNINLSGQYKDEDIEALKNIAKEDNQNIKIYIWNK